MLVLVPTREDVLAIRSIEEAFDLSTPRVTKREVALVRVAAAEGLIRLTSHADDALDDEAIAEEIVWETIQRGKASSKDRDERFGRQIGLNFDSSERSLRDRLRVKVSWGLGYFIATVHTL